MDKQPIVGLTLNYRDALRTQRCVDSLLSNGVAHVVVWDNSDDDGASAKCLARMLAGYEEITLLLSPANLGFSAAVNRGIAWIGERFGSAWVALINNDAVFLPGALDHLSAALIRAPAAVLSFSDIDHDGKVMGPAYYQRWLGWITRKPLPGSALHASGCAMLIAPERLDQPLFDETFFMYGEDAELGWRFAQRNGWYAYVPNVLIHHEGSASSGMGSEFYESRMVAAHLFMAKRLANGYIDYLLMIFGRILTLTARATLRTLRYRSFLPFRALWQGRCLFYGDDRLLMRARLKLNLTKVQEYR